MNKRQRKKAAKKKLKSEGWYTVRFIEPLNESIFEMWDIEIV